MFTLLRRGLHFLILAALLQFFSPFLQAQANRAPSGALKIGFLMDSLKVERWQSELRRPSKCPYSVTNAWCAIRASPSSLEWTLRQSESCRLLLFHSGPREEIMS